MGSHMNILLTSVGRRSYLVEYFKEALNGAGEVHVMNSDSDSPAFSVADKAVVSPLIYDKHYIEFLLNYCKKNEIKALVSLFDIDLSVLAAHKSDFESIGTKVIVADSNFISICEDKWKTFQFLERNGFNAPKTYIELSDAKQALSNKDLQFPVIVKPRWGMGSISVYDADNFEELEVLYKKSLAKIKNTYLKYESSADYDRAVLIQEKLSGQEYGLDIMNDLEGNYINTSVKMKYAMRSGETDSAVTIDDPQLKRMGERLSSLSQHPGNLDVDVFMVGNDPYILEMNPRFGGGYPFSHVAGANLPLAIVKWLKGQKVDKKLLQPKIGVKAQKDISMVILK